jgi:hypothetical protein
MCPQPKIIYRFGKNIQNGDLSESTPWRLCLQHAAPPFGSIGTLHLSLNEDDLLLKTMVITYFAN